MAQATYGEGSPPELVGSIEDRLINTTSFHSVKPNSKRTVSNIPYIAIKQQD